MNEKQRINLGYGLMCLILGTFWLLYTMEILPWRISNYMLSWRFLLMVVGTAILIKSRRNFIGLLSLGAGVAFSITQFITLPEGWENYLPPIALIIVGAILLLKPSGDRHKVDTNDSSLLNKATIFGKSSVQITSVFFKGGFLSAIAGQNIVDLSHTHLSSDLVTLEVTSFCGNNTILVPQNWDVKLETRNILGAAINKRSTDSTLPKEGTLLIKGNVIGGNIEILG